MSDTAITAGALPDAKARDTIWGFSRAQFGALVVMVVFLAVAPFVLYPVFIMKLLCFALFALAFNLLIGYVGLLSFGHAAYFGMGGYIAGGRDLCDAIRSYAPGFIFTTSLPPAIAAGATASIRHLKASNAERERHQERARALKARLRAADLPVMENPSHIVPILVGDPVLTKRITDALLDRFAIYVQPINYPTVPRGTERLRITPTPLHGDALVDGLVEAMGDVWGRLNLPRGGAATAA